MKGSFQDHPLLNQLLLPGKANVLADALSRKAEFASMVASMPKTYLIERGMQEDVSAKDLLTLAKEGKTLRLFLGEGWHSLHCRQQALWNSFISSTEGESIFLFGSQ